jgi:N-acyl-phosphatidylethanolamine-hydrolysing phospholipase D
MKPMHLNPEEAVLVHQDVASQQSIGMHWGTFKLTEEPLAEPPWFLRQVLAEKNISRDKFIVLQVGETKILHPQNQQSRWEEVRGQHVNNNGRAGD